MRARIRSGDVSQGNLPPDQFPWLTPIARAAGRLLALAGRLLLSAGGRQLVARILLLAGLLMQVLLLFVAAYLIDLGVSLMELWAELARKHLELTL